MLHLFLGINTKSSKKSGLFCLFNMLHLFYYNIKFLKNQVFFIKTLDF